jgi:hypothetical protein
MTTTTLISCNQYPAPGGEFEIQLAVEEGEDSYEITPLASGVIETTLEDVAAAHGYQLAGQLDVGSGSWDYELELLPVDTVDAVTGGRLWTADEVALAAGIGNRSFHAYTARGYAPQPDGHVGRTPVWREVTVRGWLSRR